MKPTNTSDPTYFHKVVDCQWACPAHTPVPEYIRLIAHGRYTEAFLINWESNVFPGILGRTCDRPCEPACRRGRVEEKPVAICRLKRVAADNRGVVDHLIPRKGPGNGKRVALIGAGPASLTVARDLLPLGYDCVLIERDRKAGGLMRKNIPSFRLPVAVLDEETDRILDMGATPRFGEEITSMKALLDEGFDAIFVGTGAPRGKDLNVPGRKEASDNVHIGTDFLSAVSFRHIEEIGKRVVVIGGGNTAMDCCRTALRLGADSVTVTVRSPRADMKASPWEIEDAEREGIPILDNHAPKEFRLEGGKLVAVVFEKMRAEYDDTGKRRLVPTGEPDVVIPCDDVLMAVGQENSFPWIERDIGIDFDVREAPVVGKVDFQSTRPGVFFGGDAAWGPENIIWAVAHGHQAAISIDLYCQGQDLMQRPAPTTTLISQKMGIHEWSYDNDPTNSRRLNVPHADPALALRDLSMEVELGFDPGQALLESRRCLNCDIQTVFSTNLCIECDGCVDICPVDCITFTPNAEEAELRQMLRVPAQNTDQDLYVSDTLPTARVMVKDEDVCLHCGLCAERCPTGAWDMQKFLYNEAHASTARLPEQEKKHVA
ncbi:FAD-dependent oxidoreductase [Seohaeicola zhoushanensis]|uniref:Glutamate synthase n=1 Tax=Seohaeicola zhoushanensis TaxID=1569283 RepID=A0A8J3GTZ2_9RHOB|nr:FAD-dependent oxidoreductase [Seohaeicola zhoushanensis]GHF33740.1 glutamate synthase [Seohaeicola zhoushanensis]